jgi:tetratricopeptide (TPR) repeat protein
VYNYQGDYPKALEWYHKTLKIYKKVLPKEHPDTATTYNNIAFVYYKQRDYHKALEWYLLSFKIRKNKLGMKHPDTINTFNDMSETYKSSGNKTDFDKWHEYI